MKTEGFVSARRGLRVNHTLRASALLYTALLLPILELRSPTWSPRWTSTQDILEQIQRKAAYLVHTRSFPVPRLRRKMSSTNVAWNVFFRAIFCIHSPPTRICTTNQKKKKRNRCRWRLKSSLIFAVILDVPRKPNSKFLLRQLSFCQASRRHWLPHVNCNIWIPTCVQFNRISVDRRLWRPLARPWQNTHLDHRKQTTI